MSSTSNNPTGPIGPLTYAGVVAAPRKVVMPERHDPVATTTQAKKKNVREIHLGGSPRTSKKRTIMENEQEKIDSPADQQVLATRTVIKTIRKKARRTFTKSNFALTNDDESLAVQAPIVPEVPPTPPPKTKKPFSKSDFALKEKHSSGSPDTRKKSTKRPNPLSMEPPVVKKKKNPITTKLEKCKNKSNDTSAKRVTTSKKTGMKIYRPKEPRNKVQFSDSSDDESITSKRILKKFCKSRFAQSCSKSSSTQKELVRVQYGGGGITKRGGKKRLDKIKRVKKNPKKKDRELCSSQNYVSPGTPPTPEELAYLKKWTIQSSSTKFTRGNAAYVEMAPIRIMFKGLEKFKKRPLHHHLSKTIDIFTRRNIIKVDGDLKKTPYWMQLDSPGYREKDGWFVRYKTHAQVGGTEIMNIMARHMQSNKNIKLDGGFAVAMNIFKAASPKKMSGRGVVTDGEEEDDDDEENDDEEEEEEEEKEEEEEEEEEEEAEDSDFYESEDDEPTEVQIKKIRGAIRIEKEMMTKVFGRPLVKGSTHCLAKALALGKCQADRRYTTDPAEKKKLRNQFSNLIHTVRDTTNIQLKAAKRLLKAANMDPDQQEHDREDLEKLAAHLKDYQIKLWVCGGKNLVPIEDTLLNENGKKFIGISFHRGHYDYVNYVKLEDAPRFCWKCSQWGDSNHSKKCKAKCWLCGWVNCEQTGKESIECADCHVTFKSQSCYDQHLKGTRGNASSNCSKFFYCKQCHRYDQKDRTSGEPHVCGLTKFCMTCKMKTGEAHECAHALPADKDKKKKKQEQAKWRHVVYDMECVVAETGVYKGHVERGPTHTPNMISVKLMCNSCRGGVCHKTNEEKADGEKECGEMMTFSYKDDPVDSKDKNPALTHFIKFLLEDPRCNKAQIIAQNGGGYDHPLLIAAMTEYLGPAAKEPKILLNGMKIIRAEVTHGSRKDRRTLYFLDSLQFLQMGLGKMPGAFGLVGEVKGYFPYLYNHPDNYNKVLNHLPDKEYYSPQYMTPSGKKDFVVWYEEHKNDTFILYDEMKKYCESDVRILVQALAKFIEMCEKAFDGWHPMLNGCTLASYVMFVLKNLYIKKGDVGVVPENGFGGGNNSELALNYIQWLEKENPNLKLQYKLRGGEKKLLANGHYYSADAYNEETKEVFEIYGCIYHGCPTCHPKGDEMSPVNPGVQMRSLLADTKEREENLKAAGYTVNTIWECEIKKQKKANPEMRTFFKQNKHTHRLRPREALYGGRTQAFRSKAKATVNEALHYLDFTSLYPWLNAMGTAYPRGNPKVMTSGFPSSDQPLGKRGLVFCDVLPNPHAPIGFLPEKINGKLMFVLCRSCGHDQNVSGQCTHTKVSERYLTGVWCTDELELAVSKGYKVLRYHEVWYWEEKDWVTGGFFADYIKPLLKLKHESSGWPRPDMDDKEKAEYIAKIEKNDGVILDPDNVKVNKAMRSLAKLFLNSAWGKFAQNPIKTETVMIKKSDAGALTKFFEDNRFEAVAMIGFGDKLLLSRSPKSECISPVKNFTNLMIGAQTTCGGRLRLHQAMEMAGYENMIYCDTDSVIFSAKRGDDPLKALKGEQLGFLTNEIPNGSELIEVVVMAPKVYGLKMRDARGNLSYSVKAKGVSLNSENAERITFDTMDKAMTNFISSGHADPLMAEMITFKRGDHALDGLWTCTMEKKLTPNMDKGHYDVAGIIAPFGQLSAGVTLVDDYPFYPS